MNGDCPNGAVSPITHTHSCWVFMHNDVHDNNNRNVPTAGLAAAGPVGTGMSVAGARNVTVMDNLFENNGAWGTIFVPYPDSGPPCTGGTGGTQLGAPCIYDEYGDALIGNRYSNNGFFGNPTNGDLGAANFEPGPTDCYHGNVELNGSPATSSPSNLQSTYPDCAGQTVPPNANPQFVQEVSCDSTISLDGAPGNATCLPTDHYPRQTQVTLAPLPSGLPSMDACAGASANPSRSAWRRPSRS